MTTNLHKELELLFSESRHLELIPYVKGNSIRIGTVVVRRKKDKFVVFDCKTNKLLGTLISKMAAIALAKSHIEGNNQIEYITKIDDEIGKHHRDSLFFRNVILKSNDELQKSVCEMRYEMSMNKISEFMAKLDSLIFGFRHK